MERINLLVILTMLTSHTSCYALISSCNYHDKFCFYIPSKRYTSSFKEAQNKCSNGLLLTILDESIETSVKRFAYLDSHPKMNV